MEREYWLHFLNIDVVIYGSLVADGGNIYLIDT